MPPTPRPFGLLNLDKPAGTSSRRVVDRVQWMLRDAGFNKREAKVGHAGTLDPLATGVLVVCLGPATRLIPFVQDQPKVYRAEFRLGARSETDDLEGEVVPVEVATPPHESDVRAALPAFVGRIEQVPPTFSAVHVDGRRAYKRARGGERVAIEPRPVDVHRIDLLHFDYPLLAVEIECGSGTYIRSIGRDLGEALGCGGLMTALVRTRIGPFTRDEAIPLDELGIDRIRPALDAVADLPRYACDAAALATLVHGRPLPVEADRFEPGRSVAIVGEQDDLLAIGEQPPGESLLKPRLVFVRA